MEQKNNENQEPMFYSGDDTSNDNTLDPFDYSAQRNKKRPKRPDKEEKEPFEIIVREKFLSILGFFALGLFYFLLMAELFRVFISAGFSDISSFVKGGALILFTLYFAVYMIILAVRSIKTNKPIQLKNLYMNIGFTLALLLFTKATWYSEPPNKIIFGIISALVITGFILILIKSEKELYVLSVIYLSGFLLLFAGAMLSKVFLIKEYYQGDAYKIHVYCIQSEPVDNMSKLCHPVSYPDLDSYDKNSMYYASGVSFPYSVFSSEEDVKKFFVNDRKRIKETYGNDKKALDTYSEYLKILKPELEKYNNEYFKDNSIVLTSSMYYEEISDITIDFVFEKYADKSLTLHYSQEDTYSNTENVGTVMTIMEIKKDIEPVFRSETIYTTTKK